MNGGELHFELTTNKELPFGAKQGDFPVTSIENTTELPAPYFVADNYSFEDSLLIEVKSTFHDNIDYVVNINGATFEYNGPFHIKETSEIHASIINGSGDTSLTINGNFRKRDKDMKIIKLSNYANQYSGGGDQALVDGIEGGYDYRTGFWQGVQGEDYEVTIDRGKSQFIERLSVGCFQDIRSWIWFPKEIKVYTSTDNKEFKLQETIENNFSNNEYGNFKRAFQAQLGVQARYIKISAVYPGNCPDWHLGAGGKSWIFMDEISIN